jgi:hypothetical protein
MIIRSIIPYLTFQVECKEDEIEEATEIAHKLADKLQNNQICRNLLAVPVFRL